MSSGIVCGLLASALAAQEPAPEELVDENFADVSGPTSPVCALSVMRDGAAIDERGYGMANLEYGIPITPHSVFHVASFRRPPQPRRPRVDRWPRHPTASRSPTAESVLFRRAGG